MTAIERLQTKGLRARLTAATRRFASDCSGSAAIEYILAGAIIGAGVIIGISALSGGVAGLFNDVIAKFG